MLQGTSFSVDRGFTSPASSRDKPGPGDARSTLAAHVQNLLCEAQDINQRLTSLGDRVFGSAPTPLRKGTEEVPTVLLQLNMLDETFNEIRNAIQRLEDIA
jgi:hypothetical protein